MIVRPAHHWFRLLFVWRGSVLRDISGRLALIFAVSVISVLSRDWWLSAHADSALSIPPFTLMGVALAIFLGFRNSVSYDRYWEARKQWGAVLVASRSLVRQVVSAMSDERHAAMRLLLVRQVSAFAFALKHQLRQGDAGADLAARLTPEVCERLASLRFKPQGVLLAMAEALAAARKAGALDDWQMLAIDRNLNALADASGACERIASTPIPYTYRVLMNRTVMIYCLLLPIGLAPTTGWMTPMIATFVAYTFLALEMIGEQIEEPFGTEPNDLALDAICHTIEVSVCEMAGVAPLGTAPVVKDFVLT